MQRCFTYYAKTNKAFMNALEKELKTFGVESESIMNLNEQRLNYISFKCEQPVLWRIMLYSRLIESLKIQIGTTVRARDEKEFKINIKKLHYEKFLPLRNSLEFKMPVVKAYSYSSTLFHEKMIQSIFRTTLNKLAYSFSNEDEKESLKIKLSEENEEEIIKKLDARKNLKTLPRLDVIIKNDKCKVLLNLLNKPLHMHGYKNTINWGSLRETYACAMIYETKIIEKFSESHTLFLWDPFCGCGTIPIEAFLLAVERNIRPVQDVSGEAFTLLPFHDTAEFKKFIEEQKEESSNDQIGFRNGITDLHFVASDVDSKAVDALIKNCVKADIEKYKVKVMGRLLYSSEDHQINTSINPNMFHHNINNVFNAFIGDFEIIFKDVIQNDKLPLYKNKKFSVFSNIPYGTSEQMSDKIQIKSLYRRFGKFIRRNSNLLDDVYILVNCRDEKDDLNFKNLSEIKWKTLIKFDNNGIEVEFLKMIKG